jgi:hypothetical protein
MRSHPLASARSVVIRKLCGVWYTGVANSEGHAMAPNPIFTEKNARKLVNVMARCFSNGGSAEEVRKEFAVETALKAPQTYYSALSFAKQRNWLVGGGGRNQSYYLNPDGSWRPPSIGQILGAMDRGQLEHVASLQTEQMEKFERANRRLLASKKAIADGVAGGSAVDALLMIMRDPAVSVRRKIQACEGLLAYKTPQDIADQAKQMLAAIFSDPEQSIDHRLAATTALRKSEDPRVLTEIIRPPARPDPEFDPEKEQRDLAERMRRRHEHLARMDVIIRAEVEAAASELSDYRYPAPTPSDGNS